MEISIIINQLITLFIVIALGYFLRKINIMPAEFTKQLTKLLLNVTMPATIINAVITMEERPPMSNIFISLIISVIMYSVLPLVGFIFTKLLAVPKADVGLYIFMTTFLNVGFMGFPLIDALLGNEAMLYTTVVNVVFNICSFSYGVYLINMGQNTEVKISLKSFFTPGLILSVFALVLYFINPTLPTSVTQSVSYVSSLTTPCAMLIIGTSLANIEVKELFSNVRIYIFTIIKQIILPIAICPVLKYFVKDEILLYVIFIMLSVPIANSSVLFATEYNANIKLAAKSVFISTLLSLITIPLVTYICF